MERLRAWALARLSERSTWAGVIIATGVVTGMHADPEKAEAIGLLGSLAGSALAVVLPDPPRRRDDDDDRERRE